MGGTGVVTVSQILQMAALLDGKHSYGLDQTGLAQKGGPVVSDVRIARDPIEGSNKASAGAADLLLGFDVLGAANPRNLLVADSARTIAVVNTHAAPTAAMVTNTGVKFPALERNVAAIGAATRAEENVFVDAEALSEALFGDHMPTNTVLIGAAYQAGCLPLSADALQQAIRLNGAAVEKNLAAFAWGRAVVSAPEAVRVVLEGEAAAPPAPLTGEALELVEASGASGELRRLLSVRVVELMGYQGVGLARRYVDDVMAVAQIERERGAPGETAIAEAYARGLFKLMAYKDEYEVARLHLDAVEQARVRGEFGERAKVYVMLHPPLLRAMGLKRKIKLRRTAVPTFRALRAMKGLRGTRMDPFGFAEVRRVERALPGEYRELMVRALDRLTPVTHGVVAEIAELPDVVRGYEEIKLRNVERFRDAGRDPGAAAGPWRADGWVRAADGAGVGGARRAWVRASVAPSSRRRSCCDAWSVGTEGSERGWWLGALARRPLAPEAGGPVGGRYASVDGPTSVPRGTATRGGPLCGRHTSHNRPTHLWWIEGSAPNRERGSSGIPMRDIRRPGSAGSSGAP